MRAFILRRVALIQGAVGGTVIVGHNGTPDLMRLQTYFRRNSYPHMVVDPAVGHDADSFVTHFNLKEEDYPIVITPGGELLRNPTEKAVACSVGIATPLPKDKLYDVTIVGAGPAGLAAAVYAASEGLSVLVLDARYHGGQAGASARIENYMGFPTGISGQALMGRAFAQATKFGTEFGMPFDVTHLRCGGADRPLSTPIELDLKHGDKVKTRTVIVASGARYRRPNIDRFSQFEGRGVYYWASQVEANQCAGEEVVLIGGGNSAGQAVAFLAEHVGHLHMLVRRPLADTMSRYLIDRIKANPKVTVHEACEICRIDGVPSTGLEGVAWRSKNVDGEIVKAVRHLFSFIGADPNAGWLEGCEVARDPNGFVVTGNGRNAAWTLQTNIPGVFAIGDVRAGSVKRVAAAVGEGAQVVAQIHQVLAAQASS